MVVAFYLVLLLPVVVYLVFSVLEIWFTYEMSRRAGARSLVFVQASTELTHTLLVFSYAQFMVAFSGLLVDIGAQLWWPVALLMTSILLRGSLYLVLFFRAHPRRVEYMLLLVTYVMGVLALVWFLVVLIPEIIARQFMPDVSNMPIVLWFGVPVLTIALVPLIAVYRHAFAQLHHA